MKSVNSTATDQSIQSTALIGHLQFGLLDTDQLQAENGSFAGTGGVSKNNHSLGFVPGFYNTRTNTAIVSRFANGVAAPIHVLDGLPNDWVSKRDASGHVIQAHASVITGFLRNDRFYTREQAAAMCA